VILEVKKTFGDRIKVGEIVGSQNLPLDDGEIDFNLVKPTGMDGTMHQNEMGVLVLKALDRGHAAMGRAVINDPKHAAGIVIGWACHDLIDKPVKRSNTSATLTATKDTCPVDIECGQVSPGSTSFVLMFDFHGTFGFCWERLVNSAACLNAGFLIGRDNEFIVL
jgi:hypothetical protein